jgi:hypothetical protein
VPVNLKQHNIYLDPTGNCIRQWQNGSEACTIIRDNKGRIKTAEIHFLRSVADYTLRSKEQ